MLFYQSKRSVLFGAEAFFCIVFLCLLWSSIYSQKLPFKSYTTADGLAHNRVNRIYQDKKGFLWLATHEGLSRYDGYEFVNFGVRDGLPNLIINDVFEDKQGRLWAAANDAGIALLIDKKSAENADLTKTFRSFLIDKKLHGANKVNRILIDSKDNLWCLTDDGFYRGTVSENPVFSLVKEYQSPVLADASKILFEDDRGNIWFGIHTELFEKRGDEIISHGFIDKAENNFLIDALQTKDGRILVLSREQGLFEFDTSTANWKKLHGKLEKMNSFYALIEDHNGVIWFGGEGGLARFADGNVTEYSFDQGYSGDQIVSIFEDSELNLWSGSRSHGIFRLSDMFIFGFPNLPDEVSLGGAETGGVFTNYFCEINSKSSWFCRVRERNLTARPQKISRSFNGILPFLKTFFLSKRGDLWIVGEKIAFPLAEDLTFHIPNGNKIDLREFFDDLQKENDDIGFYLENEETLWVSKSDGSIICIKFGSEGKNEVEKFQWEFKTSALLQKTPDVLWLFKRGSKGGRFVSGNYESFDSLYEKNAANPEFAYLKTIPSQVASTFSDSRGWLWLGTYYEGVFLCKNPSAVKPFFENFTTENGLLSDSVWAINEDKNGEVYFGTGRGLNRFDPQKGVWNSFTETNGLVGGSVSDIFKDSQGNIWANTRSGLTKIVPNRETKNANPPPVYITHLRIAGEEFHLSENGEVQNESVSLDWSKNNLTIDFVGLNFKKKNSLRYQYKLEGSNQEWSKPDKNRTITFAKLDSGEYRFLVRAVNEEGLTSSEPAMFQFKINSPIYLRPWFLALCVATVMAVFYAFYRIRLQKLLEIERTRAAIATDLHDDIGSNLSKISVLSEVVRMQFETGGKSDAKLLSSIADISRESVGSMSDIVWAINPQRDSVRDMSRKMRQYAEEIFIPKNVAVSFNAPDEGVKTKLPMDLRRDLFLIFKEAINNIAKHSQCSAAAINFEIKRSEIVLQIEDDGIGFDVSAVAADGNGLANMQKRAERLNGNLMIESEPAQGSKIVVRIPQF